MAEGQRRMTSEELAERMRTHAVVIRRTFSGLRRAKLVTSEKGHGGGWQLARPLAQIKLGDVYAALGAPTAFTISHREESPGCLVEQAVNRAIEHALSEAELLLVRKLHAVTLAELAADVRKRDTGHHFRHADAKAPAPGKQRKRKRKARSTS